MPVNVTMPDGSVQKFPSRKRFVEDVDNLGDTPQSRVEPEASLAWRFCLVDDAWHAERR